MGAKLTERMADVLTTAAGRIDGRAYNDGRPAYMRTRAGLITRGYLAEQGGYDTLTAEGRAAVAERIDAAKAEAAAEAAEAAELAHTAELARRLGWFPAGGDRVQVVTGRAGMVLYGGPVSVAEQCRRCGRRCRYVDVSFNGNHHYGIPQCEVAPTSDTLAGHLTTRADMLAEAIDTDPAYPAADRWRVELARFRRLAAEVTGPGPVSEDSGESVAGLAEAYDSAAAHYMAECQGQRSPVGRSAGLIMGTLADALAAGRRAAHTGDGQAAIDAAHLAATAAAITASAVTAGLAAEPAEVAKPTRPVTWHRHPAGPRPHSLARTTPPAEVAEVDAAELAAGLADQVRAEGGAGHATLDALAKLAAEHPVALAALTELAESGQVPCWWTLRCDRPADHLATHPVLRYVTACRRCRPTD